MAANQTDLFIGKQRVPKLKCCAYERECHQRQLQLEALAKDLARSNEDLEMFASMASHDLKEPLCTMTTFLQLIEKNPGSALDEQAKDYLRFALAASNRLRNLIDDLLDYSRVGTRKARFRTFKSQEAVKTAQQNLAAAIAESSAHVEVGILPTLHADSERVAQLFENLIGNAVKYRSKVSPLIKVSAKRQSDGWLFTVADNGLGIEKEFLEKVFEIFRRFHASQSSGTGVGLAICKKIVEQRGGKIWVESEPGKGSKFHFTVPDLVPRT